ncbi:MAG TPA: DsbA family protein [Candidatus Paceibacterota bacterium]|nr:DsbA family protein [Candidatus Paceibacterota bacterium]
MEHHNHHEGGEAEAREEAMVAGKEANRQAKREWVLPVSILVAAVLIGGAVVFSALYKGGSAAANPADAGAGGAAGTAQQAQPPAAAGTANTNVMALTSRDAVLGDANAPVTIVEYGDYQCPFCAQFFSQTESQIVSNYVNTGKVKMVFRDFAFLGSESLAAANAAQCANDQGKMWPYHDALYTAKYVDFNKGGSEDDNFYSAAELLKLGQQVGLDMTKFTACVNGDSDAGIVSQEKTDATNFGVNSTPTFFVNGTQILGAQPYSQFQTAITTALAGK